MWQIFFNSKLKLKFREKGREEKRGCYFEMEVKCDDDVCCIANQNIITNANFILHIQTHINTNMQLACKLLQQTCIFHYTKHDNQEGKSKSEE